MTKTKVTETHAAMAEEAVKVPEDSHPWEDQSLSAKERYYSYFSVVKEHAQRIHALGTRDGVTEEERTAIRTDPDTQRWLDEFKRVCAENPNDFCCRIDEGLLRDLLSKNFLGPEEWKAQGIDVGPVPPIPASITKELLNCHCPLHPGQKIKDTHILVLVPKTVNGEPYTPLELDNLCATRKGSGDKLMYDKETSWKGRPWASAPKPASEWVLMPKSDPDRMKVPEDKHFRNKNIAGQQRVHGVYYKEYREAKTVELMTAVLLYDLVNMERLLPNDYLRCQEPSALGGRVCVGSFRADGLGVVDIIDDLDSGYGVIGQALVRNIKV